MFGLTCEEEIKKLPPFEGKSSDKIFRTLDSENFYMIRNTDKSQVFAKYTSDDNMYAVVRIDKGDSILPEDHAGHVDHAHKETITDFKVKNNAGYTKKVQNIMIEEKYQMIISKYIYQ